MLRKIINIKTFSTVSFLSAFLGLALFFVYKSFTFSPYVINDLSKNVVLLSLTILSLLFYVLSLIKNKNVNVINNKYVRILFILLSIVIILSSLFSGEFKNAFLGKYIFSQSGLTYISIIILSYLSIINLKRNKALAWFILFLANLFITIPTIIALVVSRFGLTTFSNKLVYFIDSWDTVALASGIIIMISLIYYEVIAKSNIQKWISGGITVLHLILVACIILPDIWYALLFASVLIFFITYKTKPFYEKLSFYVAIISLLFSIMFTFSNIKAITSLTQNYSNFTAKYSGVNYTYVKPKIGLSLNLALAQLKSGRLFGSGPNEFYKVWQKDKPQSVVDSNFWSTEFVNSYSALTTLLVTIGIVGTATIIMIIVGITLTLKNKLKASKEDENYKFNEENKFYLYSTSALFIFSILIFIFFTDVANAIILLAIASVFATNLIVNYRLSRNNRAHFLLFLIILIIVFLSSRVVIRKAKAAKLINLSIASYQQDNKLDNLENNILKAINLDKSDVNYRLLTNFYLLKTQNILSKVTSSSSKDEINNIQNEATENITKALDSANTAIEKDKEDYNNYLTLGSVYSFLINTNANNREANYQAAKSAYTKATNLYPKNPSTYLTLAQLEYEYDKNSTSTKSSLDESLKVKPNYSEAYYIYSQLALENNDKDSALKYALQAIQTNPNNLNAYLQYGILTISKNSPSTDDLNNAYLAFATALQLDPNNLLAGYYLGITYTLAGQYDKAQDIVNALDKVIPNNEKISELQKFLNSNKSSLNSINSSSDSSSTKKIDIKDKE